MRDHDRDSAAPTASSFAQKLSSRGFFEVTGDGAFGAAWLSNAANATTPTTTVESYKGLTSIQLNSNGPIRTLAVEPRMTLLSALRPSRGV